MSAHATCPSVADEDAFETDAFVRALSAKTRDLIADPDVGPDALLLVADMLLELNETYAEALGAKMRAMVVLNDAVGRLQAEAARRARPPAPTAPSLPYWAH